MPSHGGLPYLVLLQVGFTLPPVLPPVRCALTAPFHPYHGTRRPKPSYRLRWRYIFCGTFRGLTSLRRYLTPCPVEPGLSSMAMVARDGATRSATATARPPPATSLLWRGASGISRHLAVVDRSYRHPAAPSPCPALNQASTDGLRKVDACKPRLPVCATVQSGSNAGKLPRAERRWGSW